jgi:drug/metabolite transporter (DMT)-like permease
MDGVATALLCAVLVFDTVSHLALKAASERAGHKDGLAYIGAFIAHPFFWICLASFVGLFLAWLAFLSRVPLGQGVMAGSITIVGVMLGGRFMFNERLTPPRVLAVSLIAVGVLLIGWGPG